MAKGYDNDPIMQGILLDLQFKEGTGTVTNDWAKPHHPDVTLTGPPAWSSEGDLPVLDFNAATPDYVSIANADAADLTFTTGNFSGAIWIKPDIITTFVVMAKGTPNGVGADGWTFTNIAGALYLYTTQGIGAWQASITPAILTTGSWFFIAFSRDGDSVRIYVNGVDVTSTPGTHIDPAVSTDNFTIAIDSTEAGGKFDGNMGKLRLWGRAVEEKEWLELFERDRDKFGI